MSFGINIGEKNLNISSATIDYIILYTYSIYFRYYPNEWNSLINLKEKAIINKTYELAKKRFLLSCTTEFFGNNYSFKEKSDDIKENMDYKRITDEVLKELKSRKFATNRSPLEKLL